MNWNEMIKIKRTLEIAEAGKWARRMLVFVGLCFVLPFYLVWRGSITTPSIGHYIELTGVVLWLANFSIAVLLILVGVVLHELLHGLVWALFASKGFRSISFGVVWEYLTPYCHCKVPLRINQYILGGIAPGIVLGIIPLIYSLVSGSLGWLLWGAFFTYAASGDCLVIAQLMKEDGSLYVQDHPSELGYYLLKQQN